MKKVILFLIIISAFSCIKFSPIKNFTLTGKVVELYRTEAAHKVSASQYCVFYSDSLKRNVCVYVTRNTYVNLRKGQRVTFIVDEYMINR